MCFDGIVDLVVQRFLFHRHDAYETLAKPLCLGFGAVDDLDDVHLGGRAIVVERRDDVRPGCLHTGDQVGSNIACRPGHHRSVDGNANGVKQVAHHQFIVFDEDRELKDPPTSHYSQFGSRRGDSPAGAAGGPGARKPTQALRDRF